MVWECLDVSWKSLITLAVAYDWEAVREVVTESEVGLEYVIHRRDVASPNRMLGKTPTLRSRVETPD